jgi:hypothetical protein
MSLDKGLKTLPEYAGKTVRVVEVALDLKDRKPISILRIVGFKWHFDENGSVKESHDKSVRLAFESFDFPEIEPLISEGDKNDVVIDITIKRMTYQNIWNNEGKYQQTGFKKSGIRVTSG